MKTNFGQMGSETYKKAKAFFEKSWGDPKIGVHSECVIEACLSIATNTDLNTDVFIIAGWLHDLGQKIDKDAHHLLSLGFLSDFLKENPAYAPIEKELADSIKNHRSEGEPETIYGLILKCADKVALINKRWLAYYKKT